MYTYYGLTSQLTFGGDYMQGQMETKYGKITIDTDVIATYAGSVAVECFGIVGMAAVNVKDGLVKLLKKDYLNHGISVNIDEENNISSVLLNSLDFMIVDADGEPVLSEIETRLKKCIILL